MRAPIILLILFLLPFLGYAGWWYSTASTLEGDLTRNLDYLSQRLDREKTGLKLSYGELGMAGFPGMPYAEMEQVSLHLSGQGVEGRVEAPLVTIEPEGMDNHRFRILLPQSATAIVKEKGREVTYEVSVDEVPKLVVRTLKAARENPNPNSPAMRFVSTPDARDALLSGKLDLRVKQEAAPEPERDDVLHEYAVTFPAKMLLTVASGGASQQVAFALPSVAIRLWQPIRYPQLAHPVTLFFGVLAESVARAG